MQSVYVAITLKMVKGELGEVREQFPSNNLSISNMLSFPDIIRPEQIRNDFYLHILQASFVMQFLLNHTLIYSHSNSHSSLFNLATRKEKESKEC